MIKLSKIAKTETGKRTKLIGMAAKISIAVKHCSFDSIFILVLAIFANLIIPVLTHLMASRLSKTRVYFIPNLFLCIINGF